MLSDSQGGVGEGPRPVLGDALVLVGALLYAVVNITEEHLLGEHLGETLLMSHSNPAVQVLVAAGIIHCVMLGDALALVALLYAIVNITEEHLQSG